MDQIKQLKKEDWPTNLLEINDPPIQLNYRGKKPDWNSTFLTVVGSRKNSAYGKEACEKILTGLRGYNITIVSGLALGIDAIAHKTALANNLQTIAVPGSGLDNSVLYPRANFSLAQKILKSGGALLSEFDFVEKANNWTFPQRNRIMAGLSQVTLIVEATKRSGTLITARLALDYNREVGVIPSSIFSHYGIGSNHLLRQGATVINTSADLLETLDFQPETKANQKQLDFSQCSQVEQQILRLLKEPQTRNNLIRQSQLSVSQTNILLSSLEIKGFIKETLGKIYLK